MPSRIDTLTYTGFGFLGVGTTGELVKVATTNSLECPILPIEAAQNIMELNLFFGYLPGYEVNLTGVIAITGLVIMFISARRGKKQQRKREERESWPNPVVRNPDER